MSKLMPTHDNPVPFHQVINCPPACYDVDGFCDTHNISRSSLYNMWKAGTGPDVIRIGKKILISTEAAARWRAAREAASVVA
jgi:hypothetical protein